MLIVVSMKDSITFAAGKRSEIGRYEMPRYRFQILVISMKRHFCSSFTVVMCDPLSQALDEGKAGETVFMESGSCVADVGAIFSSSRLPVPVGGDGWLWRAPSHRMHASCAVPAGLGLVSELLLLV